MDADDLEAAEQCLMPIEERLAPMPSSADINTECRAIHQRRNTLHNNRNLSRKALRREVLHSSVKVWENNEDSHD